MNYIYRASVTMPTPVSIPVPRVGLAEVQPVPAPTLVPRVGTAGVRPVPASIPVPWREATKLQPQSPVQQFLVSAGVSGEPDQPPPVSAGSSGKSIHPRAAPTPLPAAAPPPAPSV